MRPIDHGKRCPCYDCRGRRIQAKLHPVKESVEDESKRLNRERTGHLVRVATIDKRLAEIKDANPLA
jgi:hypothetical protein